MYHNSVVKVGSELRLFSRDLTHHEREKYRAEGGLTYPHSQLSGKVTRVGVRAAF